MPDDALEAYSAALEAVCGTVGLVRDGDAGPWTIEAVKSRGEAEADLASALAVAEAVSGIAVALERRETPAEGWLARSYQGFPEQLVGRRFAIRGTHIEGPAAPGRITLVLDASVAFGSGEHGSTRGCLRALERLEPHRPRRVLDLGTGSGILAMAAARLLHRPVLATDIDPWSVRLAAANVARNGLRGRVRTAPGNGWQGTAARRGRPYDLVFANILARPLCRMAPALSAGLAPRGTAILAGLLRRQSRMVLAAHRRVGLRLVFMVQDGDWTTLVLRGPDRMRGPARRDQLAAVRRAANDVSNTRGMSARRRPISASS